MRHLRIGVALAVLGLSGCSYDISTPDCEAILTPAEEAICASPALRKLDRDLTKLYRVTLSISGDDEENHRAEHAQWLAERNACEDDEACIAEAYRARLNVLADYD